MTTNTPQISTPANKRICISGNGSRRSYCGRKTSRIDDTPGVATCRGCYAALRADEARYKREADK